MKRRSDKPPETEVNLWDHTLLEGSEDEEKEEKELYEAGDEEEAEESPWQDESEHDEDEEPDAYGFRPSRW